MNTPVQTFDDTDKKWVDTLQSMYPVIGAVLPFYKNQDGTIDSFTTLTRFFTLVGLRLGPDGRIQEPHDA